MGCLLIPPAQPIGVSQKILCWSLFPHAARSWGSCGQDNGRLKAELRITFTMRYTCTGPALAQCSNPKYFSEVQAQVWACFPTKYKSKFGLKYRTIVMEPEWNACNQHKEVHLTKSVIKTNQKIHFYPSVKRVLIFISINNSFLKVVGGGEEVRP